MSNFNRDIELSNMLHMALVKSGIFETLARQVDAASYDVPIEKITRRNRACDIKYMLDDGSEIKVDEKVSLKYIGKSLPSFVFEIGYFIGEEFKYGWFFDKTKEATHYMLMWVMKSSKLYDTIDDINDFKVVRICMIKRDAIIKLLADLDITEQSVFTKVIDLLGNNAKVKNNKIRKELPGDISIIQSLGFDEKPINIRIPFYILKDNADFVIDLDLKTNKYVKVNSWEESYF